jgi:acyl-CoA hydrolase
MNAATTHLERFRKQYPEKFVSEKIIFGHIHAGDRIFVGTACGEPQYLVKALINYVESNPKALLDAEVLHILNLVSLLTRTPSSRETFATTHSSSVTIRGKRSIAGKAIILLFSSPRCQD